MASSTGADIDFGCVSVFLGVIPSKCIIGENAPKVYVQDMGYVVDDWSAFTFPGPPVHELSPVTSHTSMIPCLPVHGCLQKDTAMPNILGPDILEGPPHYPDYHLPQYAPRETEIQMHHEPTKTSTPQRCPNPLFHPGNSMQPSLQWFPDPERNLGPQVSPELSMTPSLPMNASLPALGTQIVSQMQQMSLCSSGSPDSEGSIGPMMPSSKYGNEQDHPEPPSKQRKERTVFSKEQKLILQEHFDHCKYPSFNQRTDLALIVGVTEYVIMIWFKNQRAKYKRMNPKSSKEELQESAGNAEDLSPSNDYDGAVKEKEV